MMLSLQMRNLGLLEGESLAQEYSCRAKIPNPPELCLTASLISI